jgi:hypothetical protein
MQNRVVGDSMIFESVVKDRDGTGITNAVVTLTVVDGAGSTVLNGASVSHADTGTYRVTGSSVGWNRGPIRETWVVKHSTGTLTNVAVNNFRIIGTETVMPYVFRDELKTYYENIEDYFDGSEETMVVDAFNEINTKLEAFGYKLPIKVKADGFHDQPLRDWNALNAITRIVSRRQSGFNREDETPWFNYFSDRAGSICKKFENKEYNLDRDYSVSEGGVSQATKTVGTSVGQMDTNWRGGIGTGFQDYTFERDWLVEITGTGSIGTVNECEFKWSNDGGFSYATAYTTNFDYQPLKDQVFVRFHRGTSPQGTNLFGVGDTFKFKTFPRNQTVGGKRSARSY